MACVGALIVTACGDAEEPFSVSSPSDDDTAEGAENAESTELTYYGDVAPIIEAKCGLCHVDGGVGPMPLETVEQVQDWALPIKAAITSGEMPPWFAGDGCNEYVGDRSLTDEQFDTIVTWVDEGAVAGSPDMAGDPLATELNDFRADLVLEMPESYTPALIPDEYRCFLLPWPESEPVYITGVGLRPGNEALVHHSVIDLVSPANVARFQALDDAEPGPGYTCFTGTNGLGDTQLIGAIEKAEAGRMYPGGTGIRVEPGSYVIMQQHYNTLTTGGPEPDQSSLEFTIEREVERPASATWFVNPGWFVPGVMMIPAGNPEVVHTYQGSITTEARGPVALHWADIHMHQLGKRGELSVIRADGTRECLLRIDDWAFDWQETYLLKNEVIVQPGDQVYLECAFDNSPENQIIVDGQRLPTRDVTWGDLSQDEMCLGNFLVSDAR